MPRGLHPCPGRLVQEPCFSSGLGAPCEGQQEMDKLPVTQAHVQHGRRKDWGAQGWAGKGSGGNRRVVWMEAPAEPSLLT